MPKNKLAKLLEEARQRGFEDGLWQGLQFGVNLYAISNNHLYGHGEIRLDRSVAYVQKLVNEVVDVDDPEATEAHINYEMKRIRRKGWRLKEELEKHGSDAV